MAYPRLFAVFSAILALSAVVGQELFPLSIIHVNDFHARFEETNYFEMTCNPEAGDVCIGGYARMVTAVNHFLQTRENPVYLNAGDNFQGTLWYNVFRWNVTSTFLNMLPADAMVSSEQPNNISKFNCSKFYSSRPLEITNLTMESQGWFHFWRQSNLRLWCAT